MVMSKSVLLVVEGTDDASRIERVLPSSLRSDVEVVHAGNVSGVVAVCRTLARGTRPFLAVRDRDLLTDAEVEELRQTDPDLFIWPGRCLENDLLDPAFLADAVRSTGMQMEQTQVRERLRALADEQREDIIADLVDARLRLIDDEPSDPRGRLPSNVDPRDRMTAAIRLQVRLRDRRDSAQRRIDGYELAWAQVSKDIDARFDGDHLNLLDGKRALGQLGPQIHPFRNTDLLEQCLLKRINDGSVPPGFASLFGRLTRLVGPASAPQL